MGASARITKNWDKTGVSSVPQGSGVPDMTGRLVGAYRLIRRIGEGGMGAVYEALHLQIGRRAAIKLLSPELARDPDIVERFFNEARAVNIVQHPDIISISELGQLRDGTAYLVMEYLEGEALSARLHRLGHFPVAETLRLSRQIAQALGAAHAKGIVHRDLKPDNVMIVSDSESLGGERSKLLDFGIAKLAEEHTGKGPRHVKTRVGMMLGTPVYMSPEQCRGAAEVDHKADVYSLGVMLYQMLVGRPPFEAEGEGELVAMHIYEEPTPVSELLPTVPVELSELVQQMLEKDRTARPSMTEVVARLEALGAGRGTGALPLVSVTPLAPLPGPPTLLELKDSAPQAGEAAGRPATGQAVAPPRTLSPRRWAPLLLGAGLTLAALLTSLRPPRRPPPPAAPLYTPPPRVRWSVATEPTGADIVRVADGKILARTPFQDERLPGHGALPVVLRREGYLDKRIDLDLSANVMVREILLPAPVPPAAPEAMRTPEVRAKERPRARGHASSPAPQDKPAMPTRKPEPAPEEIQDFERLLQK